MYISVPLLVIVFLAVIFFAKPIKKIVLYTEELIEINTREDQLEFHKRANEIAEKLEHLGPVRVKDLEQLFEAKNIATTKRKEITNNGRTYKEKNPTTVTGGTANSNLP